ncbi:U3 small nucleolar RNA-associated protein 6 homolog [Macrobrachium rosenbergii]|uniref:U3 small nucleolar RNA-associated protein 6 homolog n=1 Tax=Macrobrachium rosenbergii TaxID=79674 RepID=UPI0034D75CAE
MAELVERNIQATVAEVEEMERIGLLTKKEIRAMIEKRREYEYRLIRTTKSKADYINSINYEKKLLDLLKIRRKKMRMHEKFKEIEGVINLRVMKRCRFMTRYWQGHHDTWALRINFARAIGWNSEASIAYAEQINYHGHLESVYVEWAKFEVEERNNFDGARKILLSKAPLYHPKSHLIKRELFRLELLYVESLKKKQTEGKAITEVIEENREKVLQCEIPRAVYREAIKMLPDQRLYLDLYQVADKFPFAHDLREEIYKDLVKDFPNSESVWKLKAQRVVMGIESDDSAKEGVDSAKEGVDSAKEGVDCEKSEETEDEDDSDSDDSEIESFMKSPVIAVDKLKVAISIYDRALDAVGPSFLATYIEELMLMLRDGWNTQIMEIVVQKLFELFESNKKLLLPLHYVIWVQLLQRQTSSSSLTDQVLKDAVETHPGSSPLCVEYLKALLLRELPHGIKAIPKEKDIKKFKHIAKSAKGAYAVKIWEEFINSVVDIKTKVRQYIEACEVNDDIVAREMRIKYLDWLNNHKAIRKVRSVFEHYRKRPPMSGRLYALMIKGELTKKCADLSYARGAFEEASRFLGKTHPDFWLSYIYFEKFASGMNVGALYTRAERELVPKEAEKFRELDAFVKNFINQANKSSEEKTADSDPETVWLTEEKSEEPEEHKEANICLFPDGYMLTYTHDQERKAFFKVLQDMKRLFATGYKIDREGSDWEDVMENLVGMKVPLTVQKVTLKNPPPIEDLSNTTTDKTKKKKYELSDQLNPGNKSIATKSATNDLDAILKKSSTLKPEFLQQTEIAPYFVPKAKAKAIRKKEREKTKGPGWFDMKAPEITEEIKRDLEVLQMCPVLDPKRPYKNKDLKVLPKYFQMGEIQDSPAEFYSSRIPNKKRKRTMAEEILNDEEALGYQKHKYNEIITKKQKLEPRWNAEGGKKKKKKTKKVKEAD